MGPTKIIRGTPGITPASPAESSELSGFLGDFRQGRLKLVPETVDCRDVHHFAGRVDVAQCRAERYHVEAGEFGQEEAAFETGVDSGDLRVDTVELLIGVAGHGHDGRVLVGCPSGIAVAVADFGSGKGEDGLDLIGDVPFARLDARALRGCDENLVVGLHLDGCEVCRGLDDAFEVAAH